MSTLKAKLLERWAGLRLAHQASMLEDARKTLAQDRKAVARHHEWAMANTITQPNLPQEQQATLAEGDDGVIHVGDYHNTVHQPQPRNNTGLALILTLLAATLLSAAVIGISLLLFRAGTSAVQPSQIEKRVEPVELEVRWWVDADGKVKTEVRPVK